MFMKKKLLNILIAVLSSFSLFINYKNIYLNKGNFINLNGIIIALIFFKYSVSSFNIVIVLISNIIDKFGGKYLFINTIMVLSISLNSLFVRI